MSDFTHFDEQGQARMVDVSGKAESERVATAAGSVLMAKATLERIMAGGVKKGDGLAVARAAGLMGAKRPPDILSLCPPPPLSRGRVEFAPAPHADAPAS